MNNNNENDEKEFYNKIGKTIGWDFSKVNCELIDNNKFQYFKEINKVCDEDKILLDIGTGGGEKLLNNINSVRLIIGTDFSEEMIKKAKENAKNKKNTRFVEMDSNKLKFPNDFFNIVCARHTPFCASEVYRVLEVGGFFISEQVDEDDCLKLKEIFRRGQGFDKEIKQREIDEKELRKENFSKVGFFDIIQEEYYKTEEDLLFLLNNTPIIPNFGRESNDYEKFNNYVKNNISEKGIYLERKLYGVIVQK